MCLKKQTTLIHTNYKGTLIVMTMLLNYVLQEWKHLRHQETVNIIKTRRTAMNIITGQVHKVITKFIALEMSWKKNTSILILFCLLTKHVIVIVEE